MKIAILEQDLALAKMRVLEQFARLDKAISLTDYSLYNRLRPQLDAILQHVLSVPIAVAEAAAPAAPAPAPAQADE